MINRQKEITRHDQSIYIISLACLVLVCLVLSGPAWSSLDLSVPDLDLSVPDLDLSVPDWI